MSTLAVSRTTATVQSLSLTTAAQRAASVDARTVLDQWMGRLGAGTQVLYSRSLRRFASWSLGDGASVEDAARLLARSSSGEAHGIVEGWRDQLLADGLAPGSCNAALASLSSLVRVLRRLGVVSYQLERVAVAREERCDRSGPNEQQVRRLLDHVDAEAEAGNVRACRDAALLRLLFSVGLRRAEAAGLTMDRLDLDNRAAKVKAKGKRELVAVALPAGVVAALRRWLDHRGEQAGPVFHRIDRPGEAVRALCGHSVHKLTRRWAKLSGLRRPVRPHGLRHAGASTLVARGFTGPAIMSWGRWQSMSSASRYFDNRKSDQKRLAGALDVEVT